MNKNFKLFLFIISLHYFHFFKMSGQQPQKNFSEEEEEEEYIDITSENEGFNPLLTLMILLDYWFFINKH